MSQIAEALRKDLENFDEAACRNKTCTGLCLDDFPCAKKMGMRQRLRDQEMKDRDNQDIADRVTANLLSEPTPKPGGHMYAIDPSKAITIDPAKFNPPFCFMFGNSKGERVGVLQETPEGSLTFTGDVDAAAQSFFDHIIELHHRTLRELRIVKAQATIVVRDALDNVRDHVHPCDQRNDDIVARGMTPELQELYQSIYK